MWLGLAVLFVESLSIINAHPSRENALGSDISRRDDMASILDEDNVLSPGQSSSFNGGATAGDAAPVNYALAPGGEIASPVDQPLGDNYQIGETPNLPIAQTLGESFGLDVGLLNQISGDTAMQSNGNAQEQTSDELFLGDQEAVAGDVPCDPQQSAKLRRREECAAPQGFGKPDRKPKIKKGTQPSPSSPAEQPAAYDMGDEQCVRYTANLFPLGVCSSPKPHTVFPSVMAISSIKVFTIKQATLGRLYPCFFALHEKFLTRVNNSLQLEMRLASHHRARSIAAQSTTQIPGKAIRVCD